MRTNAGGFGFTQIPGYETDNPDAHEAWHWENLTGKGSVDGSDSYDGTKVTKTDDATPARRGTDTSTTTSTNTGGGFDPTKEISPLRRSWRSSLVAMYWDSILKMLRV